MFDQYVSESLEIVHLQQNKHYFTMVSLVIGHVTQKVFFFPFLIKHSVLNFLLNCHVLLYIFKHLDEIGDH